MTLPTCDEKILPSFASLSRPLSLKSGIFDLPHNSELLLTDNFPYSPEFES